MSRMMSSDEHDAFLERTLGTPSAAELREARKRSFFRKSKLFEVREENEFIEESREGFSGCTANIERTYEIYKADKKYRKALNKFLVMRRTRNKKLKMYLARQIREHENFIIEVTGETGMGKSRIALKWIHLYCYKMRKNPRYHLDPEHLDDLKEFILYPEYIGNGFIEIYVTYEFHQTLHVIQDVMNPTDVVFQDESPFMHGEGSQIEMDNLENCIRACSRRRWLNFIFVSPELYKIKQLHYIIEVIGINKLTRTTLAMVSLIKRNSNEIFYTGVATFNVSQPDEITTWYEANSDTIKERLQRLGGASTPTPGDLKRLASILVDAFKKLPDPDDKAYYLDSKEAFKELAITIDEVRTSRYVKEIVNRAMWNLGVRKSKKGKNGYSDTDIPDLDQGDPPAYGDPDPGIVMLSGEDRFIFDEENGIQRLLKDNPKKWEFLVQVYNENVKQGIAQDVLATKYGHVQKWVSDIKSKVIGGLGRLMGNDFEPRLKKYLDKLGIYKDVKTKGGQGGFDLFRVAMDGVIEVVSVKCYNTPRTSRSIEIKKFAPEIKMVRNLLKKGKKARFFTLIYDHTQGRYEEQEHDIRNLPSWVTVHI